jgi:beta-lactamase class A
MKRRRERIEEFNLSRRELLLGALVAIPALRARPLGSGMLRRFADAEDEMTAIEKRVGGRIGVAAFDTTTGSRFSYRPDERFAMCSTFKLLAVAATLRRVDEGKDQLDRRVSYGSKDLLDYAPITKQHLADGSMTLSALCEAAIEYSDNTAANLLLAALGGPSGVTSYARSLNDGVTRLDRNEPSLNVVPPGDKRDTTSPAAMLGDMHAVLIGDALSARSRALLAGWLVANTTGAHRIRASVPAGWRVGDKTGTGGSGATGDIAIIWPPNRKPVLVTVYLVETAAPITEREAAIRDAGRIVMARLPGLASK